MMSRHPQHDCVWCSLLFEIIPFSGDSSILAGLVLFVHHQQHTPLSILLLRVNRLPSKIRAGACSLRTHASRALMMEVEDRGRMVLLDNGEHGGHCGCFSATYMFCGVECWMWRHWERESNEVNVQKKPRRQEEKQIKCKIEKHVVESSQARYTLSCSIQP